VMEFILLKTMSQTMEAIKTHHLRARRGWDQTWGGPHPPRISAPTWLHWQQTEASSCYLPSHPSSTHQTLQHSQHQNEEESGARQDEDEGQRQRRRQGENQNASGQNANVRSPSAALRRGVTQGAVTGQ